MDRFAEQPFSSLLEKLAAPTPAPGGGSAAAWACALGTALVEMVARIELGRGAEAPLAPRAEVPERLGSLRTLALDLSERERDAYEPVLDAMRLPRDDPARAGRLDAALVQASQSPLAIAEAASEVAEIGAELVTAAGPAVGGDALAGVLLAEASAAAAATLVEINLQAHPDADELARARDARARAASAREAARDLSG
jgi:formiminotetrahydrofolate cyclodeaminase